MRGNLAVAGDGAARHHRPVSRVALASLGSALLLACTPEPASTVEMRQTVVEVVDQGRAMAIEGAMVGLVGAVDVHEVDLEKIADATATAAAATLPCAAIERLGAVALRIDFGAPEAPCALQFKPAGEGEDALELGLSGGLRVVYTRPDPGTLLASLYYEPLRGDDTALDGLSQLTWAEDGSQRLVSEIRVDAVTERQVEVQSDKLLVRSEGVLKIDGWRRWQTLMGRWEMDLAGVEFAPGAILPTAGLAAVATPFNHTIVLDFAREVGGFRVRASGGRRDRLFDVTATGDVLDAGDG